MKNNLKYKPMVNSSWSMKILSIIDYRLWAILLLLAASCSQNKKQVSIDKYTCPMHPQIVREKPGTCPICGMDLVLISKVQLSDSSITLNASRIKLANITTSPAEFTDIGLTTIVTGKIVVNEDQTEMVSSRVQGRIEKLFIKETGKPVAKGQPLYEIYSEQLQTLQQEYLLALRQFEELKQPRYESFVKSSEKKLILLGMDKQRVDQLANEKKINPKVTFASSFSGVVARIDVTEGQYVSEGSNLYRIEKLDQVWVEGDLNPNESSLIKMGDQVKVKVADIGYTVEGTVTFLSPEYRQNSLITVARILISNSKREFIPGMQANLFITPRSKKAIAVAVDAVVREGKSSYVWIAEDSVFHLRSVRLGSENSEQVEILSGLAENENIVVTGAYLLYSELVLKKDKNNP
jgi:Cu(I)/Ag(I) efflux system membrane fusion protein